VLAAGARETGLPVFEVQVAEKVEDFVARLAHWKNNFAISNEQIKNLGKTALAYIILRKKMNDETKKQMDFIF